MKILISACLAGCACRYDGKSKPHKIFTMLSKHHELIPFCPEVYGGLPTPRKPSEIVGEKVINALGEDVTAQYQKGAEEALKIAKLYGCSIAVLKAKSPSCGSGLIYDGTFSKNLINGDGITAALLKRNGFSVYTEEDAAALLTTDCTKKYL